MAQVWSLVMGFPDGSAVKNWPANAETWVQSLGREDPLKKEMTTHSSVCTWEIPRTKEPGGLQSMGSQKVTHDFTTTTKQQQLSLNGRLQEGMLELSMCKASDTFNRKRLQTTNRCFFLGFS